MSQLTVTNSLTRQKEIFQPLNAPYVGLYVCGPTVYGEPHLGHARPYITFDVVFRYLKYLGYKVRYVRNITDVGHLENDADEGESKVDKKARLERLEPMEVVQHYSNKFHEAMDALNILHPSIEPLASAHIPEQIKMTAELIDKGFAYESNGSVYFDVIKYSKDHDYGKLSGRVIEDMISGNRDLDGQDEKRNKADFALWKKAMPEHIMRWESPWSVGFPGWHIECSVMSSKYLGDPFDIHGGGMDLLFPHHEAEIAQSTAANSCCPAKYWMHNNMITIEGQKMGKSLGNFINLEQFFTGEHRLLSKAYSPMTIRFFILQTHYRSTLDFSDAALQAAEKGLQRLMNAGKTLQTLSYSSKNEGSINEAEEKEIREICEACTDQMNDDFNTAMVLASLFDLSSKIHSFKNKLTPVSSISENTFLLMKKTFSLFLTDILALKEENESSDSKTAELMQMIISLRKEAKEKKDFAISDKIRQELLKIGIQLKDSKDGTTSWEMN